MLTVIFINAIAVFLAFLAKAGNERMMTLSQLVLSLVYGVRYDYGNDYWNYFDSYQGIANGYLPDSTEPGWILLNILCQPIGYFGLIFVVTFFEYHVIYKHIKIYVDRKYWWLSIFIFTFTFNFQLLGCSMMRQFLAMTILLYSIKYIVRKKFFKFFIIILIAFCFHRTSLIFLPIYFLCLKNYKLKSWTWIGLAICIFFLFMTFALRYMEYLLAISLMVDDDKYSRYLIGEEGSYSFTIIFDVVWMALLMYKCSDNRLRTVLVLISVLSYFFLPFTFLLVILLRLMLFYSIYFIFSIPNMINSLKSIIFRYGVLSLYTILMLKRSFDSFTGETYGEFYDTFQTILSAPTWL